MFKQEYFKKNLGNFELNYSFPSFKGLHLRRNMKEKIKKIAIDLFMKYGLKSVSMDDIAKAVGISKKTLYQHVTDKKALVTEAISDYLKQDQEYIKNALERTDRNALDKMITIVEKGAETLRKIKPTVMYDLRKYYRDCWEMVESYHKGFFEEMICKNIKEGINNNVYREDLNPDIISKLFVGKMVLLANEEIFNETQFSKSYIYLQQLLYHLYGIINQSNYSKLEHISKQLNNTNK